MLIGSLNCGEFYCSRPSVMNKQSVHIVSFSALRMRPCPSDGYTSTYSSILKTYIGDEKGCDMEASGITIIPTPILICGLFIIDTSDFWIRGGGGGGHSHIWVIQVCAALTTTFFRADFPLPRYSFSWKRPKSPLHRPPFWLACRHPYRSRAHSPNLRSHLPNRHCMSV